VDRPGASFKGDHPDSMRVLAGGVNRPVRQPAVTAWLVYLDVDAVGGRPTQPSALSASRPACPGPLPGRSPGGGGWRSLGPPVPRCPAAAAALRPPTPGCGRTWPHDGTTWRKRSIPRSARALRFHAARAARAGSRRRRACRGTGSAARSRPRRPARGRAGRCSRCDRSARRVRPTLTSTRSSADKSSSAGPAADRAPPPMPTVRVRSSGWQRWATVRWHQRSTAAFSSSKSPQVRPTRNLLRRSRDPALDAALDDLGGPVCHHRASTCFGQEAPPTR